MSTATATTTKTDLTIANEIRCQLGVQTLALLGASQLVGGERSLMFSIKGCRRINKIRITLTDLDDYTVEFFKYSPSTFQCPVVASRDGVYCDNLHDVIEHETGLYVTFHAR